MKLLRFKKGIYEIKFPFLLTDNTPWQQQITEQTNSLKKKYRLPKNAKWGFAITETIAEITANKY